MLDALHGAFLAAVKIPLAPSDKSALVVFGMGGAALLIRIGFLVPLIRQPRRRYTTCRDLRKTD
jgi:hypothetical protein